MHDGRPPPAPGPRLPSSTRSRPSSSTSTARRAAAHRSAGRPARRVRSSSTPGRTTGAAPARGATHPSYRVEKEDSTASSRADRSTVAGPGELEGGGRLHGQLLAGGGHVEAHPDHGHRTCGPFDPLDEDAGDLVPGDQHVVGPLQDRVDAGHPAHPLDDRETGQQRQPGPPRDRHRVRGHEHGERQRGPRGRHPDPVETAPTGGLVLGDHHQTRGSPARARRGDLGVRGRRLREQSTRHGDRSGQRGRSVGGWARRQAQA